MKCCPWFTCLSSLIALLGCSVDTVGKGSPIRYDAGTSPSSEPDGSAPDEPASDAASSPANDDAAPPDPLPHDGGSQADAARPAPDDPRDAVLGSYAVKRSFARIEAIRSGAFADDVRQLTTHYTLVDIVKEQADYVLRERACRMLVSSRGNLLTNITVHVNDAVPQSLPELSSLLEVSLSGDTLSLHKQLSSAPLGFSAQSPSDLLPTSLEDARVVDADADGKPAVTLRVRVSAALEGDQYMAYWQRSEYRAKADAAGNFAGENLDQSEQVILGTSPGDDALAAPREVKNDPDTATNRVRMVRLAEPLDCDGLLGRLDALFPE